MLSGWRCGITGSKWLISSRERALEKYQHHLTAYPSDQTQDGAFQRALEAVEQTRSLVGSSLQKMEENFELFSRLVTSVEEPYESTSVGPLG